MFCCFNLPLAASVFQQRAWRHGHLLCRLFPLVRYALMAVSLFTVLAITINRYVMIGHPRLYPKLYRRRWLALMVACTWLFGFGALIATWVGAWGRFGLDTQVGSCSIRPDAQGRSPKEFLFIVAFVIPCLAIVVCYARIFYIVRKTALKSRGSGPSAGSSGVLSGGNGGGGGRKGIIAAMGPLSSSGFDETTTTTGGGSQSVRHGALQSPEDSVSRPLRSGSNVMQNGHQRLLLLAVPPSPGTSPNRHRLAEPSSSSGIELSHAGSYADEDDGVPSGSATPTSFCSNDRRRTSRSPSTTAISTALSQVAAVFTRSRTPGVNVVNSSPISARRYSNNNLSSVPVPGKMTAKDKKLLKMILVIFASFVICYLPITISKTFRSVNDMHGLNIAGYILIYLSTCINPIIYVVMSSEYRQAYKNLLMCRGSSGGMYHNNEAGATAAPGAGALLQQQHLARNMSQRA